MMLEVCPCNLPRPHGEHIYEWVRTGEFILCPGRDDTQRPERKHWWRWSWKGGG